MSIFDTIAENRYQEWLNSKDTRAQNSPNKNDSVKRQTFESVLLAEIHGLLAKIAEETDQTKKKRLLAQSMAIEFQLIVSLERKSMPLLANILRTSISRQRDALLTSEHRKNKLAAGP